MILMVLGLASLTYGLNKINSKQLLDSLLSPAVWPWILPGFILLFIFIIMERRSIAPVVSPQLFSNRQLNIGLYLSFPGGIAEAGLVFLPLYATRSLNICTGSAGILMTATALTFLLLTEPRGIMVDHAGAKFVLFLGTFVTALGALLLTTPHNLTEFLVCVIILGVGLSALLGTSVWDLALSETNEMERPSAQSMLSLGGSFGTMIGTTLAGAFIASNSDSLPGFHEIYLMVDVVAMVGGLLSLGLKSKTKSQF